jgi:hypothetical protein
VGELAKGGKRENDLTINYPLKNKNAEIRVKTGAEVDQHVGDIPPLRR